MNKHDTSYRLLFSNPDIVRGLFEGIVQAAWVKDLDWSQMQPVPTDYVSDKLRERLGDCVWRIPRRDGRAVYVLLMLEHQSSNDYTMALRMLTYLGLLYESLLRYEATLAGRPGKRKRGFLPVVLPVVLYSGVAPWRAATEMAELIEPAPAGLQPYLPQLRYLLVDEGALVRGGDLPENNLTALLFRLEHNQGLEDTQNLMQTMYDRTRGVRYREVRRAVLSWTRHVLLPRALPDIPFPEVDNLLEIKMMLTEHSRSWTHQWKQEGRMEGRTEGRIEGRQEGRQEGEATLLQRQLTHKFGALSEAVAQRLQSASSAQLEIWSLNLLDASTLNDVFGNDSNSSLTK